MPESESADQHIAALQPDKSHAKGCVTKHENGFENTRYPQCAYRLQGYNTITTNRKKRALYEIEFTEEKHAARLPELFQELKLGHSKKPENYRFADDPTDTRGVWGFVGQNYKIAYLPFNHNYHHVLPFECLKQLSYEELKLLQESGYNLNDGINLIILPCLDRYGYAMMLPAHPYNHSDYSEDVKTVVNRVKQKILSESRGHKLNKSNIKNFRKELEKWEDDEFWVLVDYGKSEAKSSRAAMVNDAPVAMRRTKRGWKVG